MLDRFENLGGGGFSLIVQTQMLGFERLTCLNFDHFIWLLQRSYVHKKRNRRMREKQELLRNVNAFAANMFTVIIIINFHLMCVLAF